MNYTIEIYDLSGLRVAAYHDVPLLDVVHAGPDQPDTVRGLLPKEVKTLGHTFRLRVLVEDQPFCEGWVEGVLPQWGDTEKLILDKYVSFHEVVECEARNPKENLRGAVTRAYVNREISAIVKDVINSAPGSLHYWVRHAEFPDGAFWEYQKFQARKAPESELGTGDISQGQWVGRNRIDFSGAYAKDGDTIAGLVVDGQPWPDVRLMMIDAEELTRNSHAIERHPEVAGWTDAQYAASPYRRKAVAARDQLDGLIGARGIDYIELNPHKNALGAFDDRVDAYGRYMALVYGGLVCFNAALVELGVADVYLWRDGRYLVPDMALKEFYSYSGIREDSIQDTGVVLTAFDVRGSALEALAALAYAAGGYGVWTDAEHAVHFRNMDHVDRVVLYDPLRISVQLGSRSGEVCNHITFEGNPVGGVSNAHFIRGDSMDAFGVRSKTLKCFSITRIEDGMKLAAGLLQDIAYPETAGAVNFLGGDPDVRVGDVLEFRGSVFRRLEQDLPGAWGGRFAGKLAGRVCRVRHRFTGNQTVTTAFLTSPLRSVPDPLHFIVRGQPSASALFAFRLDDTGTGLDLGFHLD